jgi:multisubunit Na+/H+ antiporter MnhC subunit
MEALVASAIGILIAAAVYLLLYGRAYELMLALLLLAHAGNLFVLSIGGLVLGSLPILGAPEGSYPDPVPQALVLTAIVINFGVTTFVIALAVRVCLQLGTDRIEAFDDRSEQR